LVESIIVIPARYNSLRLPGKPLIKLAGVPMIERTYRRCALGFPEDRIYVATDDDRIFAHCDGLGIRTIMTSPDCLTGTDRMAEVAETIPADLYINVQGDEPIFDPADIGTIVRAARQFPGEILNGVCPMESEEMFRNPSIPKVVARPDGRLLYISRAPIPTTKFHEYVQAWRQICIYAIPPAALRAYRAYGRKTPLEYIEDVEILRFIELNYEIRMVRLSGRSIAVDTPEDVILVEERLRQESLEGQRSQAKAAAG
jgi:3-deoxy-manno-octulosonate cytidylyltransferase (CMP-KDO synthetase)